jgi:flagellar biosynthesis protein FlhF
MNAIVRTFRGPDPRSALDAVRTALGDEAIILKTREVGGIFGRREIEITATRTAETLDEPKSKAKESKSMDLESEVQVLRRIVEQLRSEVRSSKAEPRMPGAPTPGSSGLSPTVAGLVRRLIDRGGEAPIVEELVRDAARVSTGHNERDLLESLREGLRHRLAPATPPWQGEGRRVIALVGPPGVGKTTTVAKIAARALLESKLKVALVTLDTYRIGAGEHIGRYGEIMGVPTHLARDPVGLRQAMAACSDAHLVLIDTAGRSDPAALQAQAQLLRAAPGAEQHLVLSAATGGRELRAAARRFRTRGVTRVIFTKLDEADGPASLLSVGVEVSCPVSCVADGQRVPDDLHPASGSALTNLVLGK